MRFTPGYDDEILMMLPFVLIPLQIFFITKIYKETPFIVRESVRSFSKSLIVVLA